MHDKIVENKTERSNLNVKEEKVLALYSFREAARNLEKLIGMAVRVSKPDWVKVVDREELFPCLIEFNLFQILCAVEVIIKREMRQGNEAIMKAGFREKPLVPATTWQEYTVLVVHTLWNNRCGQ